MTIETFEAAVLQYYIVPIASLSPMDFLNSSWQHGIDIFKTTTQIYPVMELATPVNRI
jgi:hypothetical protein